MHCVAWTAAGHPKGRSEAKERRSRLTRRRPRDTPVATLGPTTETHRITRSPRHQIPRAHSARATTTGAFHFGETISTDRANYNSAHDGDTSAAKANRRKALKVGSFASNRFGLHDMHGNALEWVEDCWHDDYVGAPVDGGAWTEGGDCATRVARGGSWYNAAGFLRSAFRNGMEANKRFTHVGFRIARPIAARALLTELGSSPRRE